jgi:hypothetical protein
MGLECGCGERGAANGNERGRKGAGDLIPGSFFSER